MKASIAQVEQEALALPTEERARLADRIWNSLAEPHGMAVQMTPELEGLLDDGLEHLEQGKTTDELRRRR
jgi:putative addiction module component (TIGR02574 family)